MKKLIILSILAFIMCGCEQTKHNMDAPIGGNTLTTPFQTIIIDSCEYITGRYNMTGRYKLAHKGNCKYCAERRKKEQEELIRKLKED